MTTFYVSKSGKDANSGQSPSNAFATLDRAVSAMGAKSSGDVTLVMDGNYNVRSPITLTSKHSNDTIAAYHDDNPVLRGGTNVANWTAGGANGVWTAKLPNVSAVQQLVVDGHRQVEARYPNYDANNPIKGGWLWARSLPSGHDAAMEMAYNKDDFSSGQLKVGEKVTVFSKLGYSSNVLTIQSVDSSAGIIKFTDRANYDIGPGSRYFISGDKALLDRPGEWSFDKTSHVLSYKAPANFDKTKAFVSGDITLISINGASNVTVKGLTFSDAATSAHSQNIDTAAIKVEHSSNIMLTGNKFLNVAKGVSIEDESHHVTVNSSAFHNIWGSAVEIMAGTNSSTISNNRMIETGEVFRTMGAVQMTESWGNTISRNLIQDVPRFAIGESNYSSSNKSGGNLIQYNTILHSGQETPDVGAIYVYSHDDPGALGDTIRYNRIFDAGGLGTNDSGFMNGRFMSAGIYMDDNASNAKIYGNFVKGAWFGGVYLHGGNGSDVWGNILVDNTEMGIQLMAVDGKSMANNKVHGNIVTLPTHSGQSVLQLDPHLVNSANFYSNIYVGSASATKIATNPFDKWQQMGGDRGTTIVSNPGFTNPQASDYSLKSGSYALTHGFKDLPWEKMAPAKGLPKAGDAPGVDHPASDSLLRDSGQQKFNFDHIIDTQSYLDDPAQSGTTGDVAHQEKHSWMDGSEFSSSDHLAFAVPHEADHVVYDNGDMDIVGTIAVATTSHNDFHVI